MGLDLKMIFHSGNPAQYQSLQLKIILSILYIVSKKSSVFLRVLREPTAKINNSVLYVKKFPIVSRANSTAKCNVRGYAIGDGGGTGIERGGGEVAGRDAHPTRPRGRGGTRPSRGVGRVGDPPLRLCKAGLVA